MNITTNSYYQDDLSVVAGLNFINWDELKNKSVLITGATGLICSFLVDLLMFRNRHYGDNISVHALSRNPDYAKERFSVHWNIPRFNYIQQDIIKEIKLNEQANFIIHGASNAFPAAYVNDPVGTLKANLWGVDNLMQYAIGANSQRVLYISSGEVYGEGNGNDFTETYSGYVDCTNPRACYPSGKRAAETLCVSYAVQYGINTVIARPCHIYGANFTETDNRAFAQFLRNVLNKNDVVLKSSGTQYRSYCYVADCASALLTVLLKGNRGEAYNIASKNSSVSIAQLAETIAAAAKQKVVYDILADLEKKGYSVITRATLNPDKLESLGWQSKYSLPDAVRRIIQILSDQ